MKTRILRLTTLLLLIGLSHLATLVASTQETPTPPAGRTIFVTNTPAPPPESLFSELLVIPVREDPNYPNSLNLRFRWADDSSHVFVSFNGKTQIIDIHTGWIIYESVTGLRVMPGDNYFAVDGYTDYVQISDLQPGGLVTVIEDTWQSDFGNSIYSVNGRYMVVGIRQGGILYDLQTLHIVDWTQQANISANILLSPDNSRLATYRGYDPLPIFDVQTGELLASLDGYWALEWSPDSRRLIVVPTDAYSSGKGRGEMRIWTPNVSLSEPIYNTTGGWRWSPDSSRLATGSDHTKIRIWDADTGELLQSFKNDLPISPRIWHDSTLISFTGDGGRMIGPGYNIINVESEEEILNIGTDYSTIDLADNHLRITELFRSRVFDIETGAVLSEIEFASPIKAISPDQRWAVVVSGEEYKEIALVDMQTGETVATYTDDTLQVASIHWSPDSTMFATPSRDETVRIWQLNE